MIKRILKIIGILVIATIALVGGYFLIVKTAELITGPELTPPNTTIIAPSKLTELSDNPIFDYWAHTSQASTSSPATTSYYYLTPTGEIYKANEGEDESIATQQIENLQSIRANSDGSLVLVTFGNKANPQHSILNIKERSWQPLPLNVRAAGFSPRGDQAALLVSTNGKSDLTIQDLAPQPGSKGKLLSKKLLSLYQKDLGIDWIADDKIILSEKPSQSSKSSLWQVNAKTAAIAPLVGEANGLMVKWSKDGSLGIKYALDTKGNPTLSAIGNTGNTLGSLNFITLPDKCMVSFAEIFCSVPNTLTSQTITTLLDAYLKKGVYFADTIYHHTRDMSGEYALTKYIEFEKQTDARHLTKEGSSLFFVNRLDQKLYRFDLR